MRAIRYLWAIAILLGAPLVGAPNLSAAPYRIASIEAGNLLTSGGVRISLDELVWPKRADWLATLVGAEITLDRSLFEGKGQLKNRYGDLNGQVITADYGWLQYYLIGEGLALWKGVGPYPASLSTALLSAEAQARKRGKGIWKRRRVLKTEALNHSGVVSGFQVVSGQVRAVRRVRGTLYLNFGDDWRTDFTVAILPKYKRNFKTIDWKMNDLKMKWVRVRGKIRVYNGLYMELYFPQQIELLTDPALEQE